MPVFKRKFIPERGAVGGVIFLLLAAAWLPGCSKAGSGAGSAVTAETAAKESKTFPAQAVAAPVHAGDPLAGKAVYDKYCHFCHGAKAMGDGPIGIAIKPQPADLIHDEYRVLKSDRQLFYSISEGVRRPNGDEMVMPRWKDVLTVQQRRDVLAYIRQLETKYSDRDLIKKRAASR